MEKATKLRRGKPSATITENGQTTNLKVDEIPHEPANTLPAVISAEDRAKQEVARFDLPTVWIAAKKKEYEGLKIAGLDDKEGQKAVHAAWQEIKNKRIAVGKTHTTLKADYLVVTRAIDGKKNELTKLLEEIEIPLKAELDRIEKEKEELKLAEERKIQERLQGRITDLLAHGMAFTGSYYTIGDTISMDVVTLKNMVDDDFNKFFNRVKAEFSEIQETKRRKEAEEQAERDRIEAQRLENEERQRKLDEQEKRLNEQRESFERQAREAREYKEKQEKEAAEQQFKARSLQLEALGFSYSHSDYIFRFKVAGKFITLSIGTVTGLDAEKWEAELADITAKVQNLKDEQAVIDKEAKEKQEAADKLKREKEEEKRLLDARTAERKNVLVNRFGMVEGGDGDYRLQSKSVQIEGIVRVSLTEITGFPADMWDEKIAHVSNEVKELLNEERREEIRMADEAEALRKASLSDKKKVLEWLDEYTKVMGTAPTFGKVKNSNGVRAFQYAFQSFIEDLKAAESKLLEVIK